jgi:hypothetical protein
VDGVRLQLRVGDGALPPEGTLCIRTLTGNSLARGDQVEERLDVGEHPDRVLVIRQAHPVEIYWKLSVDISKKIFF